MTLHQRMEAAAALLRKAGLEAAAAAGSTQNAGSGPSDQSSGGALTPLQASREHKHLIWGTVEVPGADTQSSGTDSSSGAGAAFSFDSIQFRENSSSGAEEPGSPPRKSSWTIGAEGHKQGTCTPCRFVRSRRGCHNGDTCRGCHLPHEGNVKSRPGQKKRAQNYRALKIVENLVDNPDELQAAANSMSSKGGYMNELVTKTVQKDFPRMISNPQGAFTKGSMDLLSNPTPDLSHGYPMKMSL